VSAPDLPEPAALGWRRLAVSLAIAAWLAALGLVGYEISTSQGDGRRQLEQRFAIRADLASGFVETYAEEVLTRELLVRMAGPRGDRARRRAARR